MTPSPIPLFTIQDINYKPSNQCQKTPLNLAYYGRLKDISNRVELTFYMCQNIHERLICSGTEGC